MARRECDKLTGPDSGRIWQDRGADLRGGYSYESIKGRVLRLTPERTVVEARHSLPVDAGRPASVALAVDLPDDAV